MSNPIDPYRSGDLDLPGLVGAAESLLAAGGVRAEDERISASIRPRNVRYYQSIGVLDRPTGYRGRQALYGLRHLLQLLCARLLQARGHSLSQIQAALQGRTDAELEAAALDGLGVVAPSEPQAPAEPDAPLPSEPTPTWRALVSAEIAPGVVVTIDPRQVPDTDRVLAALRGALLTPNPGAQP